MHDVPIGLERFIATGKINTREGLGWYLQAQAHCFGVRAMEATQAEEQRQYYASQSTFYAGALHNERAQRIICESQVLLHQAQSMSFNQQDPQGTDPAIQEQIRLANQAVENWQHLTNRFPTDFR